MNEDDDMLDEYDFRGGGERGKYAARLRRDPGVLESELSSGTEIRLHVVRGPKGDTVMRVPWHKDPHTGEWYSGIEGPPVLVSALFCALNIPTVAPARDRRLDLREEAAKLAHAILDAEPATMEPVDVAYANLVHLVERLTAAACRIVEEELAEFGDECQARIRNLIPK